LNVPFFFGYYSPHKVIRKEFASDTYIDLAVPPRIGVCWSVLGSGYAETETDSTIIDGVTFSKTEAVTDNSEAGADTPSYQDYEWLSEEHFTEYSYKNAIDMQAGGQYLIGFSLFNIGIGCNVEYSRGSLDNFTDWADGKWDDPAVTGINDITSIEDVPDNAGNKTSTEKYYYNSEAGTPPPESVLDYQITRMYSDPEKALYLEAKLPASFTTGSFTHIITTGSTINWLDYSTNLSVSYTKPEDTGPDSATYNETEIHDTQKWFNVIPDLDYTLSFPGLLGKDRRNAATVSVWGNMNLSTNPDRKTTYGSRQYAGAKVLQSETSRTKTITRYMPLWWSTGGDIKHTFYIQLTGNAVIGMGPKLSGSYTNNPLLIENDSINKDTIFNNILVSKRVTVTKEDSDGNEQFETTTEVVEEITSDGDGTKHRFQTVLSLPAALKIKPKSWPFGFSMASNMSATYNLYTIVDKRDSKTTTTTEKDADGNATSVTETQQRFPSNLPAGGGRYSEWLFSNSNRLTLNVEFQGGITMDILLNTSNLFEFDSLTVQTTFPLN